MWKGKCVREDVRVSVGTVEGTRTKHECIIDDEHCCESANLRDMETEKDEVSLT